MANIITSQKVCKLVRIHVTVETTKLFALPSTNSVRKFMGVAEVQAVWDTISLLITAMQLQKCAGWRLRVWTVTITTARLLLGANNRNCQQ